MPRASETVKPGLSPRQREAKLPQESRNADLEQLLVELAFALLPRGITPQRFSSLAREAFIKAAADRSRLRNGRVNRSKVAALTGLTRKEIKRILDREQSRSSRRLYRSACTPSERVVQGWMTDRRFLTKQGEPKMLVTDGGHSSFRCLVKDYGGDISPRAVLEHLQASKAVKVFGRRLELRLAKIPMERGHLGALSRVLPALIDGLKIASLGRRSPSDPLMYRVRLNASSEAELALMRERCQSAVKSLLHGLQQSLEYQITTPVRKRTKGHTLDITILLADSSVRNS